MKKKNCEKKGGFKIPGNQFKIKVPKVVKDCGIIQYLLFMLLEIKIFDIKKIILYTWNIFLITDLIPHSSHTQ